MGNAAIQFSQGLFFFLFLLLMAVRNAFLPLTSNFALHAVWVAVAVAGVLVLSGLVSGAKKKKTSHKKKLFHLMVFTL